MVSETHQLLLAVIAFFKSTIKPAQMKGSQSCQKSKKYQTKLVFSFFPGFLKQKRSTLLWEALDDKEQSKLTLLSHLCQGNMYKGKVDGTICAVVNQLKNWLLVQIKLFSKVIESGVAKPLPGGKKVPAKTFSSALWNFLKIKFFKYYGECFNNWLKS